MLTSSKSMCVWPFFGIRRSIIHTKHDVINDMRKKTGIKITNEQQKRNEKYPDYP